MFFNVINFKRKYLMKTITPICLFFILTALLKVSTEGQIDQGCEFGNDALQNDFCLNPRQSVQDHKEERIPTYLRKSLFPNVPPTINFEKDISHHDTIPKFLKKYLCLQEKRLVNPIQLEILERNGVSLSKKCQHKMGKWINVVAAEEVRNYTGTLTSLPCCDQSICRKHNLLSHYQKLQSRFGKDHFDYQIESYLLPYQLDSLEAAWNTSDLWLIKYPWTSQGKGITFTSDFLDVPKNSKEEIVVQRHMKTPLINGTKFDLRVYTLVTSVDPLLIYLFPDGVVRLAPVSYDQNDSRSLLTASDFSNEPRHTDLSIGFQELWTELKISHHSFLTFGWDFLIDKDFKVWLIEVNSRPTMRDFGQVNRYKLSVNLMRQQMNIGRFYLPTSMNDDDLRKLNEIVNIKNVTKFTYETHLNKRASHAYEKQKVDTFLKVDIEDSNSWKEDILQDLLPCDVRFLIKAEDELSMSEEYQEGYERIYPTAETENYLKYFNEPRYFNLLLQAWEEKYAKNREAGRQRLKELALKKHHLL